MPGRQYVPQRESSQDNSNAVNYGKNLNEWSTLMRKKDEEDRRADLENAKQQKQMRNLFKANLDMQA